MTISFVGASSGGLNSGSSVVVTPPSAPAAGDVVLVFFSVNGTSVTIGGGTSGFTQQGGTGASNIHSEYWSKVASGSEPATWTFPLDSARKYAYTCLIYRGVRNASPINVQAITGSGGQPAVTTTKDGCQIVYGIAGRSTTGAISVAPDAATTERQDFSQGTASPWMGSWNADENQTLRGLTATRSPTPSTLANRHNYTVALEPQLTAVDGAAKTLKWDLASAVDGGAKTALWDLAGAVAAARTLLWDVRAVVDASQGRLLWDVRAEANAAQRALLWDLAGAINGLERVTRWDLAGAVDAQMRQLLWDLGDSVNAQPGQLLWDLSAAVDGPVVTGLWQLASEVDGLPRTLLWNLYDGVVATAVTLHWAMETPGPVDGAVMRLLWDMLGGVMPYNLWPCPSCGEGYMQPLIGQSIGGLDPTLLMTRMGPFATRCSACGFEMTQQVDRRRAGA